MYGRTCDFQWFAHALAQPMNSLGRRSMGRSDSYGNEVVRITAGVWLECRRTGLPFRPRKKSRPGREAGPHTRRGMDDVS